MDIDEVAGDTSDDDGATATAKGSGGTEDGATTIDDTAPPSLHPLIRGRRLWDLQVVLPASAIHSKSNMCETPGCDLVACCVWERSLDPGNLWYCCLDCQVNNFGGWPAKEELPLKILRDDHRESMLDNCTDFEGGAMPMPDLPSGNAAASSNVEGSTTEEEGSSDKCKEEEDGEDIWALAKVFDVKELNRKKPIICSYSKDGICDLVACCQYVSKEEGDWFCCLDHQKSDYGGWPEEESELPIKFLTEENRKLILEKCAKRETIMPELPTSQHAALGDRWMPAMPSGDNTEEGGNLKNNVNGCSANEGGNRKEIVTKMEEVETEEEEMDWNKKRAADVKNGADGAESKRPRLQLGGLFDETSMKVEEERKQFVEKLKSEGERLRKKWWEARVNTEPYQAILDRRKQIESTLAELESEDGKIANCLQMREKEPEIRRFIDHHGLFERRGQIGEERKELQERMGASEEEMRKLDKEIRRQIEAKVREFELRAWAPPPT